MSFSGGVYTLPGPALVTGEVVSATENNQFRNDVAGAFNITMLRNGTSTATANLPMGGYKLTGLGVATTSGDALSYGQAATVSTLTATGAATLNGGITVDSTAFTVADTTGNTSIAGTLAVTGVTTLTANPVLNGGTANGVAYLNGSKVLTTGSGFVFDGTNVGIGTSSPVSKLSVLGNLELRGNQNGTATAVVGFLKGADGTQAGYWGYGGTTTPFEFVNNRNTGFTFTDGGSDRMRIDSSGNVGIGSTSPSGRLELSGSSCVRWATTDASWINEFSTNPAKNAYVGRSSEALQHVWKTGNIERLRIASNGYITANSASVKITSGDQMSFIDTYYESGVGQYTYIGSSNAAGSTFGSLYLWTNALYQRSGSSFWTVTTSGGQTSDRSLKTNLKVIDGALEKVCLLNGYSFDFTDEYKKITPDTTVQQPQIGVVADEVEDVFPQIVHQDNGIRRVNYEKLVAPLIEAIKELNAKVTALEEQVIALEVKKTAA